MTGFGRAQAPAPSGGHVVVEIQTLNHRFLDVECRLPEGFLMLEDLVRTMVGQHIRRGRVKVSLGVKAKKNPSAIFQADVARRYLQQIQALQRRLKVPGEVTMDLLVGLPQVVAIPQADELVPAEWAAPVKKGVAAALEHVVQMRRREGQRLQRLLSGILRTMETLSAHVRRQAPIVQKQLAARWRQRIQAMAPEADPNTVAMQAAAFVQETDVREELDRIGSHLTALRQAVAGRAQNPGRTIDFLAQELHREVNTLGSKLRDGTVVQHVVEMKGLVEKLREQAANIE